MVIGALLELLNYDKIGSYVRQTHVPACVRGREFCRVCGGAAASPSLLVCLPSNPQSPARDRNPTAMLSEYQHSDIPDTSCWWWDSVTVTNLDEAASQRPELLIFGSRCCKWSLNL